MKKILPSILLISILLTSCKKKGVTVQPPSEEIATANTSANNSGSEINQDVPVNDVFFNECCNEEVFVTGTALLVINKNIVHLVVTDLTGVGLITGFNYTSQIPSVLTNIFYSNPNEGILSFTLNMTNKGGCSFRLKATYQLNLNANGDVVVSFQNMDSMCY